MRDQGGRLRYDSSRCASYAAHRGREAVRSDCLCAAGTLGCATAAACAGKRVPAQAADLITRNLVGKTLYGRDSEYQPGRTSRLCRRRIGLGIDRLAQTLYAGWSPRLELKVTL